MANQVLVLGGRGRIGSGVVADLLAYTQAEITITGRTTKPTTHPKNLNERVQFLLLDLEEQGRLETAIAASDLVIHCAGPFRYRDGGVLKTCIEQGVNYLDVSDDRAFTQAALSYRELAQAAGVTAVINTGLFPGISNSMARQGAEQFDTPEEIRLSYAVAGSGGGAATVMETTFLTLQNSFQVWLNGQWQAVKSYTGREHVEFPPPYGRAGVYWFDVPESFTLVDSFPVHTVVVKFGSVPDLYNHLTWMVANWFPSQVVRQPQMIRVLSRVGYEMTRVTDRFSGTGVAMRADVKGQKNGKPAHYCSTFIHSDAAIATGLGAGYIAQLILSGQLAKPGIWTVEQAVPTDWFESAMQTRTITVQHDWL